MHNILLSPWSFQDGKGEGGITILPYCARRGSGRISFIEKVRKEKEILFAAYFRATQLKKPVHPRDDALGR